LKTDGSNSDNSVDNDATNASGETNDSTTVVVSEG